MFEKLVEISQTEVHVSDYCEVCGGFIEWDKSVQLLSYPPQYRGYCKSCSAMTTQYCHIVDKTPNPFIREK